MFNLVQLQEDVLQILLSSAQLQNINVVSQRKLKLKNEVDMATIWTTNRNGCAGAGILVEMPTANCEDQKVLGPILDWRITCLALENPNLNFAQPSQRFPTARGSFMSAEEIVQRILDELHMYADDMTATLTADANPVTEASIPNHVLGYRVSLRLPKGKNTQTPRSGQVQIGNGTAGTVTLACAADPSAEIRYSTDSTFPGNNTSTSPGQIYGGPITLPAGTAVRARAYAVGKLGGATAYLPFSQ